MEDIKKVFDLINDVLQDVKLDDVTSETSGNTELPDGYYLSEVAKAEITESKTSGKPMVAFQFKTVEDGVAVDVTEDGLVSKSNIDNTKGRYIFIYYPITDERSVKRFVSDMLKFEDENGESLLPKEAFTTAEVLDEALEVLVGRYVYVQISTSMNKNTGENNTWRNLVSWKRMAKLEIL